MKDFFAFESDFVDSLRCIPMQVRMKLDTCGVKLKLVHWTQFTPSERQILVSMPCTTSTESQSYREFIQTLITKKTGEPAKELEIDPHPPWVNTANIPETVQEKATEFKVNFTLKKWQNLTDLQRFALIKLSRPSHENLNFYPALEEFQLIN